MKNPLLSIIVPIYGIDKYLGICIESIIHQTYDNLEIILVDDGSKDRCPEICDLYAKKDKRIKVIHKKNGGLVSARKAGILASTGEYIGYVDGDDWIGNNFYSSLLEHIISTDSDVAITGFTRVLFDKKSKIDNGLTPDFYEGEKINEFKHRMISDGDFYKPGITTYVWNKLFKRDLIFKYQMAVDDQISIGEDAAVTYPLLLNCNRVVVFDNYEYHYRQREDSMLKKARPFEEEKNGLVILLDYLKSISNGCDWLNKQIDDYILSTCIMRSGAITYFEKSFPFDKDFKGKKVVIYNAGTFGQQLVNRINEHQYCKIVLWTDDDYWEYRRCCLDVDPVEKVKEKEFDYILIATVNATLSKEAKCRLINMGIKESKILRITRTSIRDYLN